MASLKYSLHVKACTGAPKSRRQLATSPLGSCSLDRRNQRKRRGEYASLKDHARALLILVSTPLDCMTPNDIQRRRKTERCSLIKPDEINWIL